MNTEQKSREPRVESRGRDSDAKRRKGRKGLKPFKCSECDKRFATVEKGLLHKLYNH